MNRFCSLLVLLIISTNLVFTSCMTNILTEELIDQEFHFINPIVITHNQLQENQILTLWNDFLIEYDAVDKVSLFQCDSITSYINRVEFSEGIKVLSDNKITVDDNQDRINIFNFFKKWEGLFGTSIDLTQINLYPHDRYTLFSVWQSKFQNKSYRLANDPFFHFYFKHDGTLWKIVSNLLPDISIGEPTHVNIEKMMKNIIGKTLTVRPGEHSFTVLFDSEFEYKESEEYWIYLEKAPDEYKLFLLKGISASRFIWDGHYESYSILFHPYTNEIIYIKSYSID